MVLVKKIIPVCLGMIMLFDMCINVSADNQKNQILDINSTISMLSNNSYYNYRNTISDYSFSNKNILLSLNHQSIKESQNVLIDERNAVVLNEGESVKYSVNVNDKSKYVIKLNYYALPFSNGNIELAIKIDGKVPFDEANTISLNRLWKDRNSISKDENGNDITPRQEEFFSWQMGYLKDISGCYGGNFEFAFSKGKHEIELCCQKEKLAIGEVILVNEVTPKTYKRFLAEYSNKETFKGEAIILEAENSYLKSNSTLIPTYDRSSAATSPSDAVKIRRNTIGQSNWSQNGMSISYKVNAPHEGLYGFSIKYRQNYQTGMDTYRNIFVNGEIQHEFLQNVSFPFDMNWQNKTIEDENGTPAFIYLNKGENIITLEVSIGPWSEVLMGMEDINNTLSKIYRRIIMVTGTSPDLFRDYELDREIKGLSNILKESANSIEDQLELFEKINGKTSTKSATLKSAVEDISIMADDTDKIPNLLNSFQNIITNFSSWILTCKEQPLEMDYLVIHDNDYLLPKAKASFIKSFVFSFQKFLGSFIEDYNSISNKTEGENTISVWVSMGRDQAQIIKDLVLEAFTPKNQDIKVNLSLVQGGYIEATLADVGPDVVIGVARGQPVNLAMRNALYDISQFGNFNEVIKRFSKKATIPYEFNGGTYALPNTESFFLMYYRTDVFEELGLEIPNTWNDVLELIPTLQRNNMSIGLPYTAISAQNAIDEGVGSRDLFSVLLLQNGGSFYDQTKTKSALNSISAYNAFKLWTDFYKKYSFELTYDANTRFRMGEMPILISSISMYNTFEAAAPEIKNKWAIAPVPATVDENGALNRSVGSSGTATIMFKGADNKEACWKFMDWWSSEETQYNYSTILENLLGVAGRNSTATIGAFNKLSWSKKELEVITIQRENMVQIPEVPGSYFVSRCIDNAFRSVIYSGKNAREELEKQNDNISLEIKRKRTELKLD